MRTHLTRHPKQLMAASIALSSMAVVLLGPTGVLAGKSGLPFGATTACGCSVKGWLRVTIGSEGKTVESFKTVGEEKQIVILYNGTGGETERLTAVKEFFEHNTNGGGESYITFNQENVTRCLTFLFTSSEISCSIWAKYAKARPAEQPTAKAELEIEPGKSPVKVTLLA